LLKRIYDGLVTSAGAGVCFNTRLCGVEMAGPDRIEAVIVADKAGLRACRAKVYVDGTGDGDLAAWAGAAFEKGDAHGQLQPATHCFVLTNVDPYACWYTPRIPPPARAPRNPHRACTSSIRKAPCTRRWRRAAIP